MSRVPDPRPRRGGLILGVVIVAAAAGAAYSWLDRTPETDAAQTDATFAAQRGPLMISVTESGTIQAKDQIVIKSDVEGQTTIISLVDEGKIVEEGDLLIELDASQLIETRIDRQINVQNGEAGYIKAREDLAITKSQAESDIAEADLAHRFAIEDLKKYNEGEYPRLVKEAEAKITLALEERENASETLRWSEQLFAEKYISQTELDGDRLAKNRAELEHQLAVDALGLLENFTHKRSQDELAANVLQTERSLERVKRKAAANIVQAEAELRAKESEYDRQKSRLERLDQQIVNCKILAPRAGMVIYATTGRGNWRSNDEPLEEGQSVRERQELIHLPTTGSMMAEVRIHESSLKKVRRGLPVSISIDALPGRMFTGSVVKISPLPDGRSSWLNPDLKEYPAEIDLNGAMDGVRTGMSCRAEIVVSQLEDVVYVPVQAVVRIGKTPNLYVRQGDGSFKPREVEVGLDNNLMIHIPSGLAEGEVVSLTPPLKDSGLERKGPFGSGDEAAEEEGVTDTEDAPDAAAMDEPTGSPEARRSGERGRSDRGKGGSRGRPDGLGKGRGAPGGGRDGRPHAGDGDPGGGEGAEGKAGGAGTQGP